MSLIRVENLRKTYGDFVALDGISFHVDPGETFALLGPNGAGKTTTMEILEGYRRRDGGIATVAGLDPGKGSLQLRRRVGIVLQETALEPELTVRETVSAFARYYPKALPVGQALALVGLDRLAGRRVSSLSGGQKRRLEIALGVIGDPDVLFLDEPTTGLDPEARRRIWDLLAALNRAGKTIVLTSHYLDEVEKLANRLAILMNGRILATGGASELQLSLGSDPVINSISVVLPFLIIIPNRCERSPPLMVAGSSCPRMTWVRCLRRWRGGLRRTGSTCPHCRWPGHRSRSFTLGSPRSRPRRIKRGEPVAA